MRLPSWRHFERKSRYAAALATELAAPLLRVKNTGVVTPPSEWREVLVLGDHHLGDLLYRTCSFEAMRRWFPNARFTVVTAPGLGAFVEGDNIQAFEGYAGERRDQIADLETLGQTAFDAAVCTSSWRIHEDLKLALKLDIPNRAALAHKGFSCWITHELNPPAADTPLPYAMEIWALFRQLSGAGANEPAPKFLPPQFLLPQIRLDDSLRSSCAEKTSAWAGSSTASADWQTKRLSVFTTSRQPVEQWPAESFREVVKQKTEAGWQVVVFGSAGDRERIEAIVSGTSARGSAGELSFGELAVWLEGCDAALCTDSGPRHLANAVGTPVWFFRNLRSDPVGTGVYCASETDLVPPGLQTLDRSRQADILRKITPAFVVAQLQSRK